jgi:hypothetical protein|tara:strand:- start:103 stop:666 length:564 start_codon:yes stop_codon:yes gene_type:complete
MTNFIGEYQIHDSICDKLIEHYHNSDKVEGKVGNYQVNTDIKHSVDVGVDFKSSILIKEYIKELKIILNKYCNRYIWADRETPEFDIVESFNIQHYPPGGGFKSWHYEQSFLPDAVKRNHHKRHLVFMTYLNDVTDEGETEFFYQRRYVQPRKGLTVIWPAGWQHTHRGIPSPSQEKYIITGWVSYV